LSIAQGVKMSKSLNWDRPRYRTQGKRTECISDDRSLIRKKDVHHLSKTEIAAKSEKQLQTAAKVEADRKRIAALAEEFAWRDE
jgi:hypothetical protein